MLSKNNWQEQFRKQEPKKQRFAIKKLTVGVASVLIGFTFMGMSASASADEASVQSGVPETKIANPNTNSSSATSTSSATATGTKADSNQDALDITKGQSVDTSKILTNLAAQPQGQSNSDTDVNTQGLTAHGVKLPQRDNTGTNKNYLALNLRPDSLKADSTDTNLKFSMTELHGFYPGLNVGSDSKNYELRIKLDDRIAKYVSGIKLSAQGDAEASDTSVPPTTNMVKDEDGSYKLPLFKRNSMKDEQGKNVSGVIGAANTGRAWTNPNCIIEFNTQVQNVVKDLKDSGVDLVNDPLVYGVYAYNKQTKKQIGNDGSTGFILSSDSPFAKLPVATDSKPVASNQPYFQSANAWAAYDKATNSINVFYNPIKLGAWAWDGIAKGRGVAFANYQIDPALAPYIKNASYYYIPLNDASSPLNSDNKFNFDLGKKVADMPVGSAESANPGYSQFGIDNSYLGHSVKNPTFGIAGGDSGYKIYSRASFELNKPVDQILEELNNKGVNVRALQMGAYITGKDKSGNNNHLMSPNTLGLDSFNLLSQVDENVIYKPNYAKESVKQGQSKDVTPTWPVNGVVNEAGAPTDATFTTVDGTPAWVTVKNPSDGTITIAPTNDTEAKDYEIPLTVTYGDGSTSNITVPVTVTEGTQDADKYEPSYKPVAAPQGKTTSDPIQWDKNGKAPEGTTFATAPTVPSWVSIDKDGNLILKPDTDVKAGTYSIPVNVNYPDTSTETKNAIVTVTGKKGDGETNHVYYGEQSTVHFSADAVNTHKTDADKTVPLTAQDHGFDKIVYESGYDHATGKYSSTETFTLQGDKFVSDKGTEIPVDDFTYTWKSGDKGVVEPSTDWNKIYSSAVPATTGTTLKDSEAEKTQDGENLVGNSKYRYNFTLNKDASGKLGLVDGYHSWVNAFYNFYGATPKDDAKLEIKASEGGVDKVPSDKLATLVNHDDLDKNNQGVKDYAWGTKPIFDKDGNVTNTPSVQINFNDGTTLTVPVSDTEKKNIKYNNDTDDKNFTQAINFVDGNNKALGNTSVTGTYTDKTPGSVSAADLKTAIDNALSSNKDLKGWVVDGQYPAAVTGINNANPKAITVTLKHGNKVVNPGDPGVTPVDPSNPEYKNLFTTSTRTINVQGQEKPVEQTVIFGRTGLYDEVTNKFVDGQFGDWFVYNAETNKLTSDKTGSWSEYNVPQKPENDSLVDNKKATKVEANNNVAPNKNQTVNVTYAPQSSTPVPYDPSNKDMNKDVTRTITVTNPIDGTTKTVVQTVHFVRGGEGQTGAYKKADGTIDYNSVSWTVAEKDGDSWKSTGATTGTWAEYTPAEINGYTADPTKVEANNNVGPNAESTNVAIKYNKNSTDADAYTPTYPEIVTQPGQTIPTTSITWEGTKPQSGDVTSITPGSNVPSWVHVDKDGNITGTVPADSTTQVVTVPVTVNYKDGTKDTATATIVIVSGKPSVTNPTGPKDVINNPDKLPEGTKVTWKPGEEPDPHKTGEQPTTVIVTVPGHDPIEVPTKVTYTHDVDKYTPTYPAISGEPGKQVTVDPTFTDENGKSVKTPDGTKFTVGTGAPEGVKVDPKTGEITYTIPTGAKVGDKIVIPVTVTYQDGSQEPAKLTVTVSSTDADKYTPETQPITTPEGVVPEAPTGIKNLNDLPKGTTAKWTNLDQVKNDVKVPGTHDELITVIYPDGSQKQVTVQVTVPAPEGQDINTDQGVLPDPSDAIANKDQMPDGTKYEWIQTPDVNTPGDHTGVVRVTFPDGSHYDVTVTVHVAAAANDNTTTNGNGNGKVEQTSVNVNTNNGNQAQAKKLPQTGNNSSEEAAVLGLGLASLASLFGLGGLKKRNADK